MIYSGFASVYDRLMQDIPYTRWVQYLTGLFKRHGIRPVDILDIGCGTGNVTIPLAEMGYKTVGLDISPEMLSIAEEKARSRGLSVTWVRQDMKTADLGGLKFDLVISMTDSLNYLSSGNELLKVFRRVKTLLRDGGWFVFDLNSAFKIREVFGNNVFTLLEEDITYIWQNHYRPDTGTCMMELTFFVREKDGKYRRFSEEHQETGFETEEVSRLLTKAGFKVDAVYGEDSFSRPAETTERVYFVARSENE